MTKSKTTKKERTALRKASKKAQKAITKMGRPPEGPDGKKRAKSATVLLSGSEYKLLIMRADAAWLSIGAYIRKCLKLDAKKA